MTYILTRRNNGKLMNSFAYEFADKQSPLVLSVSPPQWPLLTERVRRSKWMVCTNAPSLPSTCDRKQTMHPTWTICILFRISVCSAPGLTLLFHFAQVAALLSLLISSCFHFVYCICWIPLGHSLGLPGIPGHEALRCLPRLIATQKKQIHISAKIFARALLMMLVTAWVIDATQGSTYGGAQGSTQGASHWRKRLRKSTEESDWG